MFTALEKGELGQQINGEIRDHLTGIYQMIKVLVDEIYHNRDQQKEMMGMIAQLEGRLEKIDSVLDFSGALPTENRLLLGQGEDLISPAQARQLKDKVAQKSRDRSDTMRIWAAFKAAFNVARYIHLQRSRFEEALRWIERYPQQ